VLDTVTSEVEGQLADEFLAMCYSAGRAIVIVYPLGDHSTLTAAAIQHVQDITVARKVSIVDGYIVVVLVAAQLHVMVAPSVGEG